MGGNATRLGALVRRAACWPCALLGRAAASRSRCVALPAPPTGSGHPPVRDWRRRAGDPSVAAPPTTRRCSRCLEPRAAAGPFRVEIPFTANHWEARWVAPAVPLARGWERQLDGKRNPLFYDGRR